jgi:molybdenum cofactor biosynthesis protein B
MASQSSQQHKTIAQARGPVSLAIVTCSDTRTPETDTNHHYLLPQIEAAGHRVVGYRIIKDEPELVSAALDEMVETGAQLILFNGGTGIAPRDTTFDVLSRKLEKHMPGFGELFRMLSYQEVGAAAMLSRATAGTYRGRVVVSTPGSPNAVQVAWEKLIKPELEHLAWEVAR